jgi:hypothetical protein
VAGIIDADQALRDPLLPTRYAPGYSGDGVHLTPEANTQYALSAPRKPA